MGLLTNKCPNEDCDARILKRANHCSKCGWAGPSSTTTCQACSKTVGRASKFCWNCGGDIAKSLPPRIQRDRWIRDDEEFAVRVYPEDLKGFLKRKVKIEPGTLGLIEKGGRIRKDIEWGEHTLDGVFKLTQPTSIILVNAADALLRLDFEKLHDFHGVEMGCTLQVFVSIGDHSDFVANVMEGGKRRVTENMLETLLCDGLYDAVQGVMNQDSLENMYENTWWRGKLEEDVRDRFSRTLDRYGLNLSQITFVNFTGDNFETLRETNGENYMGNHEADAAFAKMELQRRMRKLDFDAKAGEKIDYASAIDEVAENDSRIDIKKFLRGDEYDEVVAAGKQEADLKARLREIELGEIDREQDRVETVEDNELDKLKLLHVEEITVIQSRIDTEARTQRAADMKLEIEMENLRRDSDLDRKLKEQSHGTKSTIDLQKANSEAQIAALKQISEGETAAAKIDADARVKIAEADSTKDSAVAQAITEQQEKRIQDIKESSDSMKEVSMRTVDAIAKAKTPDWTTSRSGAGGPGGDLSPCPKCQTPVPVDASFCERCGHDFKSSS